MPQGYRKNGTKLGFQKGNKINLGKLGRHWKLTEEQKLKHNFFKGHKINLGKKNNLGKHWKLSEKTREKMSLVHRGENNANWNGGITPENHKIRNSIEFKIWRNLVFERDNYICQKCEDNRGRNLEAHHIKSFALYSELRFILDNGITFCDKCHNKFHKIYTTINNNIKQLIEFLKS